VNYEPEMLQGIVPYGIAANIYAEDDENGITNVYREKYMLMLERISFASFAETEDEI